MTQEPQIIFGPFQLERPQGRLWRGDQVIPLRPQSLAMLVYLAVGGILSVGHAAREAHKALF